jgi:hypothetical protein
MATADREYPIPDGPWSKMIDSISPSTREDGACLLLQNAYPLDPALGDGIVGRPGFTAMGDQLGSSGRRRVQATGQFTKQNGTEYTVAIVGGHFYTYNWGTDAWTEVVTNANLATASITLSQTAKVALTPYNNTLHISDGVNLPWTWDGQSGTAGLVSLTNSPVLYGRPAVHQGRLFGIKASDPTTFVWSEVNAANTGYESGSYGNAWTIAQTDPNRLYHLIGTNEGLLVLRARSATAAGGGVSSSFSSEATREGISETTGTASPWAAVWSGTTLLTLDADLRPHAYRNGSLGFTPIWGPFRETIKEVPRTPSLVGLCLGVDYRPADLVLLAVPEKNQTECTMLLVFSMKTGVPTPVAVWRGFTMTDLAMVKNATGEPVLVHGDTDGYVYRHGNPEDAAPWDDEFAGGAVAIRHVLECQALGYAIKREKVFDRIDIAVRALSTMTLSVSAITPYGSAAAQTVTVQSGVAGWDLALWDEMLWDPDVSLSTQEAHGEVGIDLNARWIKPRIVHETLGEQFGLVGLTVTAYPASDDPEAP